MAQEEKLPYPGSRRLSAHAVNCLNESALNSLPGCNCHQGLLKPTIKLPSANKCSVRTGQMGATAVINKPIRLGSAPRSC